MQEEFPYSLLPMCFSLFLKPSFLVVGPLASVPPPAFCFLTHLGWSCGCTVLSALGERRLFSSPISAAFHYVAL